MCAADFVRRLRARNARRVPTLCVASERRPGLVAAVVEAPVERLMDAHERGRLARVNRLAAAIAGTSVTVDDELGMLGRGRQSAAPRLVACLVGAPRVRHPAPSYS